MSFKFLYRVVPLLALPISACEGCIDLEGYRVVPDAGSSSGGGGGGGGAGGAANVCADVGEGRLFVLTSSLDPRADAFRDCVLPARPGVDVLALAPRDGSCIARARLTTQAPEQLRVAPLVRHATSNALAVAGTFAGSALEFPLACNSSASVSLPAPAAPGNALFAARLRLEGTSFCTEWAHRGSSEAADAALEVRSFEQADDGSVLVAGALGGALTRFEGGDRSSTVGGGAFFAAWTASGSIQSVTTLATLPGERDAALAIAPVESSPVVVGAAKLEDPACHACNGTSHVSDAARSCPVVPDAGNDGGDASSNDAASDDAGDASSNDSSSSDATADAVGDVASAEAGSDAAPGPAPDGVNAFAFIPRTVGGCGRFESFGSDRAGPADAQAIFDLSKQPAKCRVYATGAAGRDTWRTAGNDPRSALAPGRDDNADGFLVGNGGGGLFNCVASASDFNLRFSATSVVTGERARARCREGVTAAVLVGEASQSSLVLERCGTANGCDPSLTSASLDPALAAQLVVMNLADDGELLWHGGFGPVSADPRPRPAAAGAPLMDLALDRRDDAYLLLVLDGALRTHNVELSSCAVLTTDNAASRVWIVKLAGGGFGDRGQCRWAHPLG